MATSIEASPAVAHRPLRCATSSRRSVVAQLLVLALLPAAGCALTPKGLEAERERLDAAGTRLQQPLPESELPLPADGDDWRTLLRRALLANGELRGAWFEWKSAIEKVDGASAWPNSNLQFSYSYTFSDESVKSFDRSTFGTGFDSMENLSFPGKAIASGRVALAEARRSGEEFRAAKFALQRRVLDAWLDLVLAAEKARLAEQARSLAAASQAGAEAALVSGGTQSASAAADIAAARADDEAAKMRAELAMAKARLAALVALPDAGRIATPSRLPEPRALPADPAPLLAAADEGPMSGELDAEARKNSEDEKLAKLQWVPDINPFASFVGGAEQMIGAAIVLPTTFVEIRSAIRSAKAMRLAATAKAEQARRDSRSEVAARIVAADDAARERRLLEDRVLPAAGIAAEATASAYGAGRSELGMVVEARSMIVDVRGEIAEAAVARERQLAAIEETLGADLETFTPRRTYASAASTGAANDDSAVDGRAITALQATKGELR